MKEIPFRVIRIRCWRITTSSMASAEQKNNDEIGGASNELSFEYLVAKGTLKWVKVYSDQAVLLSMCLQSMVDELLLKKEGRRLKRVSTLHLDGYSVMKLAAISLVKSNLSS